MARGEFDGRDGHDGQVDVVFVYTERGSGFRGNTVLYTAKMIAFDTIEVKQ